MKNDSLSSFTPPDDTYCVFPYLIIRRHPAIYEQIPLKNWAIKNGILEKEKSLIKHVKEYKSIREEATQTPAKLCLVINENHCFYFEGNSVEESTRIPYGGTLIASDKTFVAMNTKHYRNNKPL
jgi:hypothetical protein